jgi:N-terminal acetyltransferase B complex non-catalytic subunit
MALSEWLAPYHDHVRPPPAVALAQATRAQETKLGKKQPSVEALKLGNGDANGNGHDLKKCEEPPAITDPPLVVLSFFGGRSSIDDS